MLIRDRCGSAVSVPSAQEVYPVRAGAAVGRSVFVSLCLGGGFSWLRVLVARRNNLGNLRNLWMKKVSVSSAANLTSPCHEQKSLIYGLAALMHLLHFPARRDPSWRLGKEFQQSQFTENGVKVFGNAGDLDFQTFTFHLQTPQSDGL